MKKEYAFILELCRFLDPDPGRLSDLMAGSLDFPAVLGQILYHRMGAVCYDTLNQCGLLNSFNREFRNTLKTVYDAGVQKTKSFLQTLQEMKPVFAAAGVPYALLKGAYLAAQYPAGLRTSNDIDVLISPADITPLANALKANGFAQGYIRNGQFIPASRAQIVGSRLNRGETVPFIKKIDLPQMAFLELDLNFSLDCKPGDDAVTAAMLACAEETLPGGLKTLCPADFYLQLCAHLYKEASVISWVNLGRDLALYKFCDLYLMSSRASDRFFEEVEARARICGLEKETYYSLFYTKMLFSIQSKGFDALLAAIKPADTSYLTQVFDPAQNKTYRYQMEFIDWIFCPNRKEHLYETGNA